MELTFYNFCCESKRGAILIEPKAKYDSIENLDEYSTLINNNVFFIDEGEKVFDVLRFAYGHNFAISSRFKELLEKNNISGWGCFPIIIEGLDECFFAFQNLGKAGPILNLEALNNYETENTEFDIDTWDHSDIFNLQDTLVNACTTKVKEIIEEAKITNISIDLLSTFIKKSI